MIALGFTDKFLLLYSSVLEPDGDLTLREVGSGRDSSSLVFGDELAGGILLFQLLQLDFGVRDSLFASATITADLRLQWHNICEEAREILVCAKNQRHLSLHKVTYNQNNQTSRVKIK